MILIVDSGSTKADWCIVSNHKQIGRFQTVGLNPYFVDSAKIINEIQTNFPFPKSFDEVLDVRFFGAGCADERMQQFVSQALKQCFTYAQINISTDIVGAAIALFGENKGIASILGTGANSCLWNGQSVEQNSPSLGYILGDEGSGAYIGKRFVSLYLNGDLPADLCEAFRANCSLQRTDFLNAVYRQPNPNRFLASYTKFLSANIEHEFVRALIYDCFVNFFDKHIVRFSDYRNYPLGFIGSIAYYFKDILQDCAESYELKISKIIKQPIDGLSEYFCK